MALSKKAMDVAAIKETIIRTGEFRIHLNYSRGGTVTARMWHPDGFKVGSAGGGGYDKRGTALGQTIALFFGPELKGLPLPKRNERGTVVGGLYGLSETKEGKRYLDGACGMESMIKILELGLGFDVRTFETGRDCSMVLATKAPNTSHGFSVAK